MNICVRTLTGAESFFELGSEATVLDLKLGIQTRLAVPRKEQRLAAGQLVLHDGLRLANIAPKVTDEDGTLQLCLIRLDSARPGMLEGLASGWLALQDLGEELRSDKELVLAAVSANGWCLEFASPLLRADKDVAMVAVQSDAAALEFVSEALRKDPGVVLAAAQRNGWALAFAAPELRADKEIVLAAVASNPLALQFASEDLRHDAQVVRKAVSLKGCALRFAASPLRRDTQIVLSAVRSDASAIQLTGCNLRTRSALVMQAVRANADVKKFLPLKRLHLIGNEAMVDDLGFIVPFKGGKVPPKTFGDDTSSVHGYLHLAHLMHSVPRKLQLSHPTEISSTGEVCRPSTGMRLNPSLLIGDQGPSSPSARSISTAPLPSASKDKLEAENNWALENSRVHAMGLSLEEEAEAQQFNAKCCWICENWCEYRVTYSQKTGKSEAKTVYALTSLDGFTQPIQLKQLGNQWTASKMLPPSLSAVEVLFIVDGELKMSNSHPVRSLIAKKTVVLNPDIFGFNEEQGSVPHVVETDTVNTINAGLSAAQRLRFGEPAALCILESANDRTQVEVLPRIVPEKMAVAKTEVKKREVWTFESSTFRHYLRDMKCKPDECFDRDWSQCKVHQLIKNESARRELAGMLRHGYMKWILAFWYSSMIDFQSHRYAVGLSCNSWREVLLRSEGSTGVFLLDDVACKSSDLDCIYVAANTIDKEKRKTLRCLPDKALARFQFLEAILRLAFKRFLRAGPANASAQDMKSAADALQDLLHLGDECLEKRTTLQERLFTEECCLVYRDFQDHLKVIYEGFTSVSSYPGRRNKILSFGGWLTLCSQAMPEETSTRLFREAFALGREIRVDETSHFRHMELSWPEYLVSLGALQRLQPDYDPEFFADSLTSFFETLIPLSESLLAGNPATAGRKVGNHKDQALLVLIAQIFQEADDDDTGTIDESEFRTFFEQPKVHTQLKEHGISVSNLNMLFKSMDADGQGMLTFDELCDGFLKMASIMRSNERAISYIRKVFAESDGDGSGTLDKDEFNHIFDEPSVKKKMESFGILATDLADLFSLIDEDGSGQVSEDEVVAGFIMLRDPKTAGERGVAILSKIFTEADFDGSGALDKFEYVTAFSEDDVTQQLHARNLKVPDWEGLFEVLDSDGSGTLAWDELREGLVSFWARHQMDDVRK
eukprot:symbB.v1.2.006664.t2/scaffold372.1/size218212/16